MQDEGLLITVADRIAEALIDWEVSRSVYGALTHHGLVLDVPKVRWTGANRNEVAVNEYMQYNTIRQ